MGASLHVLVPADMEHLLVGLSFHISPLLEGEQSYLLRRSVCAVCLESACTAGNTLPHSDPKIRFDPPVDRSRRSHSLFPAPSYGDNSRKQITCYSRQEIFLPLEGKGGFVGLTLFGNRVFPPTTRCFPPSYSTSLLSRHTGSPACGSIYSRT